MNDVGDCRTAPATPGLLKTSLFGLHNFKRKDLKFKILFYLKKKYSSDKKVIKLLWMKKNTWFVSFLI